MADDEATIALNLAVFPMTDSDIETLAKEIRGTGDDVFTRALALLLLADSPNTPPPERTGGIEPA